MNTEAGRIAEQIRQALADLKRGSLKFFGDWFGRSYDNVHTIVGAASEGNCLIISSTIGRTARAAEPKLDRMVRVGSQPARLHLREDRLRQ